MLVVFEELDLAVIVVPRRVLAAHMLAVFEEADLAVPRVRRRVLGAHMCSPSSKNSI